MKCQSNIGYGTAFKCLAAHLFYSTGQSSFLLSAISYYHYFFQCVIIFFQYNLKFRTSINVHDLVLISDITYFQLLCIIRHIQTKTSINIRNHSFLQTYHNNITTYQRFPVLVCYYSFNCLSRLRDNQAFFCVRICLKQCTGRTAYQ